MEERKEKMKKEVQFNPHITIRYLYVWAYAYQKARIDGKMWNTAAADRDRFKMRCVNTSKILNDARIFDKDHREKVYLERIKEI